MNEFVMPCEWRDPSSAPWCGAPATHVLVNGSGETIRNSCEAHVEPFLARIRVKVRAITRDEWWAATAKPWPTLGGIQYERGDAWEPDSTT